VFATSVPGARPPATTTASRVPPPFNCCLAVFKLPPVTQAPVAMFAFHSSVIAPTVGTGEPPKPKAKVLVPVPSNLSLPVFKSFVSVQITPFQVSVVTAAELPPKAKAASSLVPPPAKLSFPVFKSLP